MTSFFRKLPTFLTYIFLGILSIAVIFPSAVVMAAAKKKSTVSSHKKKSAKKYKKRKRSISRLKPCNTELGKKQAMDFIRSDEELARLANVEYDPSLNTILAQNLEADGEILTDADYDSEEDFDDLEGMEEEALNIDISHFQQAWLSYMEKMEGDDMYTPGGIEKKVILDNILDWVGTRYIFGGTSRTGIDCSAFTQRIFANSAGVLLPRTAAMQYEVGKEIKEISDLQFGDLVFFNTRKAVYVSHIGIYLGNNLFAHASSRYGVTLSSFNSTFYRTKFIGGKRLTMEHVADLSNGTPRCCRQPAHTNTRNSIKIGKPVDELYRLFCFFIADDVCTGQDTFCHFYLKCQLSQHITLHIHLIQQLCIVVELLIRPCHRDYKC